MKRTSMLLFAAAALFMVSCGGENTEETTVEEVSYTADASASTISWKGEENEQHFHVGSIKLKEGSLTMKGDELVSGSFVVDMNSINSSTEGYPAEKLAYLNSHLMDTAFFFVAEHPEVKVDLNSYADGKLNATFHLLGTEITQDAPVTIEQDENGAVIKGKFGLDISSTTMPYLKEVNEETGGPALKPELQFEVNIVLKK